VTAQPPPGSREAVAQGCTCPVLDNGYGAGSGRYNEAGQPLYWICSLCPLHSKDHRGAPSHWMEAKP